MPLDAKIRKQCDEGNPAVASDPQGAAAQIYLQNAARVSPQLAGAGKPGSGMSNISVSDD